MRVAFIITGLSTGGAEMMLLKLLQNIDRNRFQITVFSLTSKGEIGSRIEALDITVHALGMHRGRPNLLALWRLVRHLRRIRADVVQTWMYHADFLGGLAARWAGCRRVVWCLRNSNLSSIESRRSTLLVVRLCAWLSHWVPLLIVSCSQRACNVHAALGYQARKMRVIPNGFDLGQFRPDAPARDEVRTELGLSADVQLVGLVARFDPQKNHVGFIQVAALVLAHHPKVHFVLAGKDVDAGNAALQTMIAAYPGLAAHVHLLGQRNDVPRLMAAFDVLASSSSHGEAFPNVLGEALASGVPCVVTDVGDSADIVGDAGRVVAVGDMSALATQISTLLHLPSVERQLLGEQARARVQEHYEIRQVTLLYEKLYTRVVVGTQTGYCLG